MPVAVLGVMLERRCELTYANRIIPSKPFGDDSVAFDSRKLGGLRSLRLGQPGHQVLMIAGLRSNSAAHTNFYFFIFSQETRKRVI